MQRCWQLLVAVAAAVLDMPASQHGARKAALLRGARQYLERGHAAYMQTIIQSHRSEACPPITSPVNQQSRLCISTANHERAIHGVHALQLIRFGLALLGSADELLDRRETRAINTQVVVPAAQMSSHARQAAMGGDPSRLGQVQAFLRVVDRDLGTALDFDQPGGTDTSWQRIYYCLRSGYHDEALQASCFPLDDGVQTNHCCTTPRMPSAYPCYEVYVPNLERIHGGCTRQLMSLTCYGAKASSDHRG